MEPRSSWVDYEYFQVSYEYHGREDVFDDEEETCVVCINSVLPDDVLERVLYHLPIATIITAGCVCKKWNYMVHTERFIQNLSSISPQKPWYFMFISSRDPYGHVYDPMLLKWYRIEIPYVGTPGWNLVSSSGLVCFMDTYGERKLCVCNPITRHCRKLEKPPGENYVSNYCALAISLTSQSYIVATVTSKQSPREELDWDLSINVYNSENKMWACPVDFTLQTWRGGNDSVICGGVLYFVVYLTRNLGFIRPRYGVLAYDLACQSFDLDVDDHVVSAPCPVTCMRLINLEEELVMVGGIREKGWPVVISGIGIWVLRGKEWEEISRMPNELFRGFGVSNNAFASSGFDKLIYIKSYGSPALLMFDMNSKEWTWSYKCSAAKKLPLQLFSGICFEPRLDIVP